MEDKQLNAFVNCVADYFRVTSALDVSIGTPYLAEYGEQQSFELTGVIGVSGVRTGWVQYTAPRVMLRHLLLCVGETDTSRQNVRDIVGEVANTISGNLRKIFGAKFLISVPEVKEGRAEISIPEADRCYVVPIYWRTYQSAILVYLR